MNPQEKIYHTVFGPVVTEKAVMHSEGNIHTFRVSTDANKLDIKKAVEALFEVKVDSVKTVNVKGKRKNFGRTRGKRNDWKKAYVRLADGESLDMAAEA